MARELLETRRLTSQTNGEIVSQKVGQRQSIYNELRFYIEKTLPWTNLLKFLFQIVLVNHFSVRKIEVSMQRNFTPTFYCLSVKITQNRLVTFFTEVRYILLLSWEISLWVICKYHTCDITVHNEFLVLYGFLLEFYDNQFLKIAQHTANDL